MDIYLGGSCELIWYLCNINAALLDSVDHAEVFSVRPSLIKKKKSLGFSAYRRMLTDIKPS